MPDCPLAEDRRLKSAPPQVLRFTSPISTTRGPCFPVAASSTLRPPQPLFEPFTMMLATLLAVASLGCVSASPAKMTVLAPIPGDVASATIIGVDDAGHTTYVVDEPVIQGGQGGKSTTATVFHATLVAGSDYASETLSMSYSAEGFNVKIDLGAECTISGDKAICKEDGNTTTLDAAVLRQSLTQVLDVATATSAGGNGGATQSPSGGQGGNEGAAGRNVVALGAVVLGAVVAGARMVL
ncbi:hypothetical protein MKEN_00292400 [Mycena kentingensis (nom. inval.)]|nr:hypothetical protein MKEN_00292400 [Mycena kentingensis (nom. inval.)]